jgi:hypothetical protein
MNMTKRSERSGVFRKAVLLVAVAACPGLACKSTGAIGQPRGSEGTQCIAALMPPQESLTYTLSCDGFSPEQQRVVSGAHVTFVSACDTPVRITFSSPEMFGGLEAITLENRGARETAIAGTVGGCYMLCFDSEKCPPEKGRESKTGNLDVYTSGNEPDPKKASGP